MIYGTGSYRQQLFDSLGNLVWDQLTTDTSATNNVFWAGTAGGTPNIITVTDAGFNGTDGSIIQFVALSSNTTTATLNPSSFGAIPITKPTGSGPVSLAAGDIAQGNVIEVVYRAGTNTFQLLSAVPSGSGTVSVSTPQGYLTLSSDPANPIITADVTSASTVYYTPYVGNQVPIYNGVAFVPFTFSQFSLTLTANFLANTIYDVCIFANQGSPTMVAGPAWSNSGAGTGNRGIGANSAQLARVQGFWVNAVAMIGTDGGSSFSIAANQCSYVGSILIDSSIGQSALSGATVKIASSACGMLTIACRSCSRQAIQPRAGRYPTNTVRASNASSANVVSVFTGLVEEELSIGFTQRLALWRSRPYHCKSSGYHRNGVNSLTTFTGTQATAFRSFSHRSGTFIDTTSVTVNAQIYRPPASRLE